MRALACLPPVLVVVLCAPSPASAQGAFIGDLLDRYARGEFAAFTPPRTALDLQRVREALKHEGDAWTTKSGARNVRRRQIVAATMALEAARASLDVDWGQGRELIEWASGLLRKAPPDEPERLWHLAALALMQGSSDNELLVQQQKLAWPRFEEEPRLLLGLVVMLESQTWPDPDRGEPWDTNDAALEEAARVKAARRGGDPNARDTGAKAYEYERRTRMRTAITLLEDLSNIEAIRPEVLLRLGTLHLRLQHSEIAVEQFEDVLGMTAEPFLTYLAHFLTGMAKEQDGDRANAMAAYRAALNVVPRAHSASVALASLLFIGDGRAEAAALIEEAVRVPLAADPWRQYQEGDFRFWLERLDALQRTLQ